MPKPPLQYEIETTSDLVPSDQDKEGHMGISEMLSEYGLIALLFHFTVWISSVAAVFTLLSSGLSLDHLPFLGETGNADILGLIPGADSGTAFEGTAEAVSSHAAPASAASAAAVSSAAGRLGATLAIVEVVGPLRLALTVAATPAVSRVARRYAFIRDVEDVATRNYQSLRSSAIQLLQRKDT